MDLSCLIIDDDRRIAHLLDLILTMISVGTERGPVLFQTHRRLSSNDGTVPAAVATTLAHPGAITRPATSTPRTVRLTVVETADTDP